MCVALAGPDAGDLGALRHVLNVSPQDVLMVDSSTQEGLQRARRKWPGVRTHYGDVLDVLRNLHEPISFLNLDFTCALNPYVVNTLEIGLASLPSNGVGALTFYRGREYQGTYVREALSEGGALPERYRSRSKSERMASMAVWAQRRWAAYTGCLTQLLNPSQLAFKLAYASPSPMAVIATHRALAPTPSRISEGVTTDVIKKTPSPKALISYIIVSLRHKGLTSEQIAHTLNISRDSVKAYFANDTRGTYRR